MPSLSQIAAPNAAAGLVLARHLRSRARFSGAYRTLLAAVLLAVVLAAPLAATRLPFLVDYPNHMARMHVLATGAASPALHRIFRIAWAFIPNMVMDLVVPALAQVMPLDVAGRVFIALAILLPPAGVVALHRAWFGRRALWPAIAVLTATSAFLVYGFLNYIVGLGLALLGAAWHARARTAPRPHDLAVAALWATACMLSHIFAFGVLGLLMLSSEAGDWRRGRIGWRLGMLVSAAAVPVALYKLFGPSVNYVSGSALGEALRQILSNGLGSDPFYRATWVLAPFTGQGPGFGIAAAALIALPILGALFARRLLVAPQAVLAIAALGVGYLALPSVLVDDAMVYQRLILPTALVVLAGVWPRLPRRFGVALAVAVACLVAARSLAMAVEWRAQSVLLAQVERVIAPIPPGARVLAVRDGNSMWHADPAEPSTHIVLRHTVAFQHLAALVTMERDAFWPMIFSAPGKQPIALRQPYEDNAQSDGYLPLTGQLALGAQEPAPVARCLFNGVSLPCVLRAWPERYDYLLRFNAPDDWAGAGDPAPGVLIPVAKDGWVALYRVRPAGAHSGDAH